MELYRQSGDELSTIGGDWDSESRLGTAADFESPKAKVVAEPSAGDLESTDIAEDEKKYYEANQLIVEGFKCPDEYTNILTPMEFEEMVNLFIMFDANKSGTIDKHEAKKILQHLNMEASLERAEELLRMMDEEGDRDGEIDFEAFCRFIVMIKRGDERLEKFHELLEKISQTPLGELEHQTKLRGLKINFKFVEQRVASLTKPSLCIFELSLSGLWHKMVDGILVSEFADRKYQGIGQTTRDAKYQAAAAAVVNLGDLMPGVRYQHGEFPEEWISWVDENLLRGVDANTIVSILASKGFHPYLNPRLMHRIIVSSALEKYIKENPISLDNGISSDVVKLDHDFLKFVKDLALSGLDGEIILELLRDRMIDLEKEQLHFAQKLKYNEIGSLTKGAGGSSGGPPFGELLDFWHACREGYYDMVDVYCKCGMPVNQEKLSRRTGEWQTGLSLAAMGGHVDVIQLLLDNKADVYAIDRRGQTALHHAARHGCTDACNLLIDRGANMFIGDFLGESPLHLAARNNKLATLDLLAYKGLELTRLITSDKVRVKKGVRFDELAEIVFHKLPKDKLLESDTIRFEKSWLNDGANVFIALMDPDVRHMLSPSSVEIMQDVLKRFDPRPETGIFVSNLVTTDQTYIPTIPTSTEFILLLKHLFRQLALDKLNKWKRSALHVACDGNVIRSHEKLILRLVNFHGCNLFLKDMHGKYPLDLLTKDKRGLLNMPSATEAREQVISSRREIELNQMYTEFNRIEQIETELRRKKILFECMTRENRMTPRLWEVILGASILRRKYKGYEMYEDPDSKNFFYVKVPKDRVRGDAYTEFLWYAPSADAKIIVDTTNTINYLKRIQSTFFRTISGWECYRCNKTGIEFFYNKVQEKFSFEIPKPVAWSSVAIHSSVQKRLGYGREWELRTDKEGNEFYRNLLTRECVWDKPSDAVEPTAAEKLCSAHQLKGRSIEQRWYSCEQCNRAWKSSPEGSNKSLKICEPCIFRCHKGHKGVRFMQESNALCICSLVCKVTNSMCQACNISDTQKRLQSQAIQERLEAQRRKLHNSKYPPVLALVPSCDAKGKSKTESGWMICRLALKLDSENDSIYGDVNSVNEQTLTTATEEDPFDHNDGDDSSVGSVSTTRQVSEDVIQSNLIEGIVIKAGLPPGWIPVYDNEDPIKLSFGDRVLCSRLSGPPKVYGTIRGVHPTKPGFYKIKFDEVQIDNSGQLLSEVLPRSNLELLSKPIFYCNMQLGLSVWSVDEAIKISFQKSTAQLQSNDTNETFGTNMQNSMSYDSALVNSSVDESKNVIENGVMLSMDTEENVRDNIDVTAYSSHSMRLNGPDWLKLEHKSELRRAFDSETLSGMGTTEEAQQSWDEMYNPFIEQVFYVNNTQLEAERAALKLQNIFRIKKRKMRPNTWTSYAYSFDIPDVALTSMKVVAGWSYLRRRSQNVGEFQDIDGGEWEEYIDKITSEYYYWEEETNKYRWDKPPIYQKQSAKLQVIPVGEEVVYRFPGRRNEEIAVITKIRYDDETGEDLYDVHHKYVPDLEVKWVARVFIKIAPKEGDALALSNLEKNWRNQIRKQRENEERKLKRDQDLAIKEELAKLEQINAMVEKWGNVTAGGDNGVVVSQTTTLMKGRMQRIVIEAQEVKEEIDRIEGAARRQKVKEIVEETKKKSGGYMTRGDVLTLTRSLELKLLMENKVAKQHQLSLDLLKKREEAEDREYLIDEKLTKLEVATTTPRSLLRRKIIRKLHMGMKRQMEGYVICEWGCGDWVRVGHEQMDHQQRRCRKRIVNCVLGCTVKHTEEYWLGEYIPPVESKDIKTDNWEPGSNFIDVYHPERVKKFQNQVDSGHVQDAKREIRKEEARNKKKTQRTDTLNSGLGIITIQQHHETEECVKRLIMCPLNCLEWVKYEMLEQHVTQLCTKRPAKPLECRLGCGCIFGGKVETLIQAEEDRLEHEREQCEFRTVRCNWAFEDGKICAAQMKACDREEHREYHMTLQGIQTYTVAGTYLFRVSKSIGRLKVQVWGGGGGSGYFLGRRCGKGGGGAFVEAIIEVPPNSVLEIVVGSGGLQGVAGTEIEAVGIDDQRRIMQIRRGKEIKLPVGTKLDLDNDEDLNREMGKLNIIDSQSGLSLGGKPGGGDGYGGGGSWASGGGGGYSIVSLRTQKGSQALLVAGGGGGGGSLDGLPGGGMYGIHEGVLIDPICGGSASVDTPGVAGESGSTYNAAWAATAGSMWQGGTGCEFGAGGGGGYFGGGGGGTNPGISGGGGGGSSYVYMPMIKDNVIIMGYGSNPGGLTHNPPTACGIGEWDKVGGPVGQGGVGTESLTRPGNSGCVRIFKPGHY